MDIRLETIHDLHEAIHDRFNREGVEIAFPQQDLHLRSFDAGIDRLGSAARATEQGAPQAAKADAACLEPSRRVA